MGEIFTLQEAKHAKVCGFLSNLDTRLTNIELQLKELLEDSSAEL